MLSSIIYSTQAQDKYSKGGNAKSHSKVSCASATRHVRALGNNEQQKQIHRQSQYERIKRFAASTKTDFVLSNFVS